MKPYYSDDWVTIYHGDCREMLPGLEMIHDLLLTDPPYGLGDRMQGGTWGSKEKYSDLRKWDVAPSNDFLGVCIDLAVKSIIWGGNCFALPPSRSWLVWDKQNAVPTMADCEFAWSNYDRPAKRLSLPVGVHHFGHPTEKPLELISWCLSLDPEAGTIVDPFMGSGTTLRAAKDLQRHAIGIEIEERYCEIAAKRCAQEVLNLA